MALVEVTADLKGVVKVLTRIADALDRAYPIRKAKRDGKPESALLSVSDEELADMEAEEIRRTAQGLIDDERSQAGKTE